MNCTKRKSGSFLTEYTIFSNDCEGEFLHRPNRFKALIQCGETPIEAHCANPGRMRELLVPGRSCILEYHENSERTARKTAWSLAAVRYNNHVIPLNSAGANRIAETLIIPRLFPGADSVKREFTLGSSRFDFLITEKDSQTLVEVKSCSLVEYRTAMFPDAPTQRGARHVTELKEIAEAGDYKACVLFVVVNPDADRLVPGIHTDPAFAQAVMDASPFVNIRAATVHCDSNGSVRAVNTELPVDTSPCTAAAMDTGVYLVKMFLSQKIEVKIGALGMRVFESGTYVYAGSAKKNLTSRLNRHLRKRKKKHWHIDYLREYADSVEGYALRTLKDLECVLAGDLAEIAEYGVPGFGCSDCSCTSHLYKVPDRHPDDPMSLEQLVLRYRHRETL